MATIDFDTAFQALTGNPPFPWQCDLYETWFNQGKFPASCNLPTGLGKTSVIAVWLIALANGANVPRRLVYVVNRRTVVDQTTNEVEKYRDKSAVLDLPEKLAISTLRGQFADNREWSADPSRPAVICGTVDMIGSRLLFSGYGCGFKTRPLHAGFLGQDSLIVHDEAHLEPAFQELLKAIEKEQREGRTPDFRPLKVMELTATSRAEDEEPPFTLSDADYKNDTVQQRVGAKKKLVLQENKDAKKLADEIADRALAVGKEHPGTAILVFTRSVDDVGKVVARLNKEKQKVQQLTGTLRGLERDRMADPRKADGCPIFARFLRPPKDDAPESERWKVEPARGTVYLVCTSAGEVGVNISADHLVCDLSTFESMAQRFGRVNRFGECKDTEIHVVHPPEFKDDDLGAPIMRTLGLLELLGGNASPSALADLKERAVKEGSNPEPATSDRVKALRDYVNANKDKDPRLGGYAPQPIILPTSDILFDAWALTTIRDLPGRPPVEEYLHGVEDEKKRETQIAWRTEVKLFQDTAVTEKQIGELLDEFPLKPHELLRDATYRVQDQLAELAKQHADKPAWVVEPDDTVRVVTLGDLAKKGSKGYEINLSARTVVLPPNVGGLTETGTLNGKAQHDEERKCDVAGLVPLASGAPLVRLVVSHSEKKTTYKLAAPVLGFLPELQFDREDETERDCLREHFPATREGLRFDLSTDNADPDNWSEYLVLKPVRPKQEAKYPAAWPSLGGHLAGAKSAAEAICSGLTDLPPHVATAASLAAGWHDLGKDRGVWQRGAGNHRRDRKPIAKTLHGRAPENLNHFRHELASMVDVCFDPAYRSDFEKQTDDCRELLLHMIATHHGRGRPHFPANEALDPERPFSASEAIVAQTPQRFATLQRKYGRWGLAYLESLLRAADAIDSKRIEETPIGEPEAGSWPRVTPPSVVWTSPRTQSTPSISVNVDPTNPGQFFACCGLLELADRLWPGAEGWFAEDDREFHIAGKGTLAELLAAAKATRFSGADEDEDDDDDDGNDDDDDASGVEPLIVEAPVQLRLDWWAEKSIKTWAGSMNVRLIAIALCNAIDPTRTDPLNQSEVVYDPPKPIVPGSKPKKVALKKREPFYFDSRRGPNAHSRDVGFSPNDLKMTTIASPVVEFLCLLGLQRSRPAPTDRPRVLNYCTWKERLLISLLPTAVSGLMPVIRSHGYQFENRFRSGQKKLKAYYPSTLLENFNE